MYTLITESYNSIVNSGKINYLEPKTQMKLSMYYHIIKLINKRSFSVDNINGWFEYDKILSKHFDYDWKRMIFF